MLAMAISFDEGIVPLGYKIRLNNYMSQIRADNRSDKTIESEESGEKQ
jgi:hypothetical protein